MVSYPFCITTQGPKWELWLLLLPRTSCWNALSTHFFLLWVFWLGAIAFCRFQWILSSSLYCLQIPTVNLHLILILESWILEKEKTREKDSRGCVAPWPSPCLSTFSKLTSLTCSRSTIIRCPAPRPLRFWGTGETVILSYQSIHLHLFFPSPLPSLSSSPHLSPSQSLPISFAAPLTFSPQLSSILLLLKPKW